MNIQFTVNCIEKTKIKKKILKNRKDVEIEKERKEDNENIKLDIEKDCNIFKWDILAIFLVCILCFWFLLKIYTLKFKNFCRIQTWIARVEGENVYY